MVNYENEMDKLKDGSADTWKPDVGSYSVTILQEPEEAIYHDDEKNTDTPQWKIPIKVEGKQLVWYVGKGKTFSSAYGQLILLGKSKGSLKDSTITILVIKTKDKKTYTITEAIPLMKEATVETQKVE